MDRSIIEQNVRHILHSDIAPSKVVKLADSLNLQSSTCIPLKPNQEPARIHACCVIAIEKLSDSLDLPLPDTRKPPIPPAQYTKLLSQFRNVLLPSTPRKTNQVSGTPVRGTPVRNTPVRNTPVRNTQTSPERTPRAARRRAVDFLKDELDDPGAVAEDDDEEEFPELEIDTDIPEFSTPRKRPPSQPRGGSPSPRKSPRKRISGPTPAAVESLGARMGLETPTIDAVLQAFTQYEELVKDKWGLVYGLLVVVSERAEPRVGMEHERRLVRALQEQAPQVQVDREEWINWVNKIVTGQTWIMNISHRPEPQPVLLGAPGGWGLGVEFNLV